MGPVGDFLDINKRLEVSHPQQNATTLTMAHLRILSSTQPRMKHLDGFFSIPPAGPRWSLV